VALAVLIAVLAALAPAALSSGATAIAPTQSGPGGCCP
jgi:hypothetical protein